MSDSSNGHTAPRVSIIVPAYNAAATIAGAIDSALAQQFEGFEVIVVNDGSTDATAHVLDGYGDRIRILQQPNCGSVAARNAAARAAGGEYLAFLDADDLWLPGKLKLTVEALERSPRAVAVFSDHIAESGGKREIVQRTNSSPSLAELLSGGDAIVIYPTTAESGNPCSRNAAGLKSASEDLRAFTTRTCGCVCVSMANSFTYRFRWRYTGKRNMRSTRTNMERAGGFSFAWCVNVTAKLHDR